MFKSFFLIFVIVFIWFIANIVRIRIFSDRAAVTIKNTKPYESIGNGQQILVLGDSIAYGTGTSSPENSVVGLISREYSDANVTNLAKNGKRTKDLAEESKNITKKYDLIVIVIGGNDVLRPWENLNESAKNIEVIYKNASKQADKVIALSTGNFKYTTFFLWPANYYFSSRSISLRNSAIVTADKYENVNYIDIISWNEEKKFDHSMEANDHLHLNDNGAKYWLEAIKKSNVL